MTIQLPILILGKHPLQCGDLVDGDGKREAEAVADNKLAESDGEGGSDKAHEGEAFGQEPGNFKADKHRVGDNREHWGDPVDALPLDVANHADADRSEKGSDRADDHVNDTERAADVGNKTADREAGNRSRSKERQDRQGFRKAELDFTVRKAPERAKVGGSGVGSGNQARLSQKTCVFFHSTLL